jgi:hypothetical protein
MTQAAGAPAGDFRILAVWQSENLVLVPRSSELLGPSVFPIDSPKDVRTSPKPSRLADSEAPLGLTHPKSVACDGESRQKVRW